MVETFDRMRNFLFSLAVMHEAAVCIFASGSKLEVPVEPDIAFLAAEVHGVPVDRTIKVDAEFIAQINQSRPVRPISYGSDRPISRIFQTSGTTGGPKLLAYEIETICDMTAQLYSEQPPRMFSALPFESYAGSFYIYYALQQGRPAYLSTGSLSEDKKMMERCNVQGISTSTAVIHSLFSSEINNEMLSRLEMVVNLGAPISQGLVKLINAKSGCRILNRLGATEVGIIASRYVTKSDADGLVGSLYPGVEVRVIDADSKQLPFGHLGRLGFRTPGMRESYFGNPEATSKSFLDGFFYSGDEGYVSESGELFMVGRSDERINVAGVKIDPAILEGQIMQFAGVADAAIFGVDVNGARILAVALSIRPKYKFQTVKSLVSSGLKKPWLSVFVEVPRIPRNVMGKVQRNWLESEYTEKIRLRQKKF
jgi:acyl-coenzyme A synthetase/AMP-(fatty) acid ligase